MNPQDPTQGFLQCQIDQIYDHGLDGDCRAFVEDLPYDYRTVVKDYFGFNHKHGDPGSAGFDEHGHFGNFDNDCPGNVIHYVSGEFDMIYDEPEEDKEEAESDAEDELEEEPEEEQAEEEEPEVEDDLESDDLEDDEPDVEDDLE